MDLILKKHLDQNIYDQLDNIFAEARLSTNGTTNMFIHIMKNIHYSYFHKSKFVIYMLSLGVNIDEIINDKKMFLKICINKPVVKYLIDEHNLDINMHDGSIITYAVNSYKSDFLNFLIDNGLYINITEVQHYSLFHKNNIYILNTFINYEDGILIEVLVTEVLKSQTYAPSFIRYKCPCILLDAVKKYPHSVPIEKIISLLTTVESLNIDDLQYLVNTGLDLTHNNDKLFAHVCENCDSELVKYMVNECGGNVHNSEMVLNMIRNGKIDNVIILLDHGIEISDLHIEAAVMYPKLIKMFIDYGVDVNRVANIFVKDLVCDTTECIELFINNGIDFNSVMEQAVIDAKNRY